ncbi:MAG: SpoVA/SpoVAEb family sporulation membrane protein [Clostridium sp.]|nr:MAG: SpoVA/SpoVAEb family sporulation membrane protein [Clostridium sp.]
MMLVYSFLFLWHYLFNWRDYFFDNSKLTFGHITSMFVVVGAILSIFGIYDKIASVVGVGANLPIVSFGNSLTNGAYKGFMKDGFIGLFSGMLAEVSTGVVAAVVFFLYINVVSKAQRLI